MKPHKCPVCNGTGLVSRPPGVAGDQEYFASSSCGPWPCRACGGCGVLWEPDEDVVVVDSSLPKSTVWKPILQEHLDRALACTERENDGRSNGEDAE